MDYTALSHSDREKMLETIGICSIDELFSDIPESIRLRDPLNLSPPMCDMHVDQQLRALAEKNIRTKSFIGAGAYRHYIPAVVDAIAARGEFYTAYTPYQPEVSQGTLVAIFEFQTMIARFTGMDIANASMYDGATATAEAILMAHRTKGGQVIISEAVHPHYREVVRAYMNAANIELHTCRHVDGKTDSTHLKEFINNHTAAVVVQSPNFFGCIEDIALFSEIAHASGAALVQVITEALSLGILKRPGMLGADIVCGEAQSFGNPVGFGGPLLGFLAAREEFLRKMPGRLVGKTVDAVGNEAYVLTLQTREQHIRRERATSNICTNEGLCMLRAVVYLSLLGGNLRKLALLNHRLAAYLRHRLAEKGFTIPFNTPYFNEFVVCIENIDRVYSRLCGEGYELGLQLKHYFPEMQNCVLVCATELHTPQDIDALISTLEGVV